jgi:hypothetical protein
VINEKLLQDCIIFKIVPVIFSKRNFGERKLLNRLSYPLFIFGRSDTRERVQLFRQLVRKRIDCLGHEDSYQTIRSLTEDIVKLAKDAFALKKFHKYTTRSVKNRLFECTFGPASLFLWAFAQRSNYSNSLNGDLRGD